MSQTTTDTKLMTPEPPDDKPEKETRRDLQRAALRDLIALTGECAEIEKEVDRKKVESLAETEKKDKRGYSDLEHSNKRMQDAVAQKYTERQGQIEARYGSDNQAMQTNDEAVRNRIRHEHDAVQREVKKKYDQAVWLADSVLEASQNKCAIELKKAHELHIAQTELLDGKRAQSESLMGRYNQVVPAATIPAATDAPAPVQTMNFDDRVKSIERHLYLFERMSLPNMFVGARPHLIWILIVAVIAAVPQALTKSLDPIRWDLIGIWGGVAAAVMTALWIVLYSMAKKQIFGAFRPLQQEVEDANRASKGMLDQAELDRETNLAKAAKQQKGEIQAAREMATPIIDKAAKKKEAAVKAAQADLAKRNAEIIQQRDKAVAELDQWRDAKLVELKNRYEAELQATGQKTRTRLQEIALQYKESRDALEAKWREGLALIQAPMGQDGKPIPVGAGNWKNWVPPTSFPATVRFGELQIDPKTIIAEVAGESPFTLPLPENFTVPAVMAFPRHASVLLHADRSGHDSAIRGLQMLMTRLLTGMPPGRARFTLIDPVGLGQNFAGYMHLADYDEALVTNRIWTDSEQIDQRLANLTEHMETVIQKYLRNEFETIDDYNAQAGELAEPYRFLVIADFPVNFSDDAFRRLSSIASTGARCGVYTLIARDTRVSTSHGTHMDDLEGHSINLVWEKDHFVWKDEIFRPRFPLTLDSPPGEDELTELLHVVGKKAKEAKRVEVPFDSVAPQYKQFWTLKSNGDLGVAIGRSGATRLQTFRLGRGVAQHALVAGKTGSGKSTMLHALIANLAMWYSPDEIELYLIDFKKGVEFKTYASHMLPHARAIAVESDREFGLSVLQRIDAELGRRGNAYRKYGVQDLASFREASGETMPRTLLVIDEFQEFFSEDDKLAQDAALLLDRLVRQGRAFGIHVLLGSQTIGGSSGLSRSTIGQIAVRIALQTSEADSQLILGDGNSAARLLSRPGEAIYNDAGGLVEGNSPFQVAYLSDERKDTYLDMVTQKAKEIGVTAAPPIVFEGNAPADYRANPKLATLIDAPKWSSAPLAPVAWLGDPVAIKDPTSIPFRRQNGVNILIIGQNDEAALAMMSTAIIGLAAQHSPEQASFYILDGSPADSPSFGVLAKVASAIPHEVTNVEWKATGDAMGKLTEEYQKRQTGESSQPPAIFVFIYGLQRYRNLRKQEDSFSFSSSSDEPKAADPGKQFTDLLREGPPLGIHFVAWVDTVTALDRALDRGSMREFDSRVLFQMSATDSSNLIDSPAANKLGVNRALAFSEEQGTIEKFRPYALADASWLAHIKEHLASKAPK